MAKFGMGGLSNTRIGIVGRNLDVDELPATTRTSRAPAVAIRSAINWTTSPIPRTARTPSCWNKLLIPFRIQESHRMKIASDSGSQPHRSCDEC
jgi:hypothetical protein